MLDCHIHLERGPYTLAWLKEFVKTAIESGLDEIYLLEHSHRFYEFIPMYKRVCEYSSYQRQWFLSRNTGDLSINEYFRFIQTTRQISFPVKIKFGLEVCYFEEFEQLTRAILNEYSFDFSVGSVHWVDGFGFDHKKELWDIIEVDRVYSRYYEIMGKLIESRLFNGVAHPDSIKAFGHKATYSLEADYRRIAKLLVQNDMYAEQSGGLNLNYSRDCELGLNPLMLRVFKEQGVRILTASDAHSPTDAGANIPELHKILVD